MLGFITNTLMSKLIGLSLVTALVPITIVGYISYTTATSALEKDAFNNLSAHNRIMGNAVTRYLGFRMTDVTVLAKNNDVKVALEKLDRYHDGTNGSSTDHFDVNSQEYEKIYNEIDGFFRRYMQDYRYHDAFLISLDGHVMYTVAREGDLGTNLAAGTHRDSGLARLWEGVVKNRRTSIVDYSHYEPSSEIATFIGAPVLDDKGNIYAVVALQRSGQGINTIVQERTGMGEIGETYLVGPDLLMRSDSRFESASTILKKKVETESVRQALQNKSGTGIIKDYRGKRVLSSYWSIGLDEAPAVGADFDWAVISEIDAAEAFAPARALRTRIIIIALVVGIGVGAIAYFVARGIVNPIRIIAQQVVTAANEISVSTTQLSTSAAETATAMGETTTTIEELKQTVQMANEKAQHISENARKTAEISEAGGQSTQDTIEEMNSIKEQMESIADSVVSLSEQSQSIGEIIATVDDLTEQSNLLAVNASIEAAKAGEQGKGFGVVADQIKSLAEQSKQSTAQVRGILSSTQKATSTAVMVTEQGSKAVEAGVKQAIETGESIAVLADSVTTAAQSATQIAASSQQQLVAAEQVATAMEDVKKASAENAMSMEQLSTSAANLNELGLRLQRVVEQNDVSKE